MTRSLTRCVHMAMLASATLMFLGCEAGGDDGTGAGSQQSTVDSVELAVRNKCGNGVCGGNESCSSCPQDCGSCGGGSGGTGMAGSGGTGGGTGICSSTAAPPATYQHVVVFSFENRTWSNVGLGFSTMPYLHSIASQCSYFSDWTETNTSQSSLTQYIGATSGVNNTSTVNDCSPSTTCR